MSLQQNAVRKTKKLQKILETSRGHSPVLTQSPIYCYKKFLLSGRAAQTPGEHSQLFNGRPTWVYNRTRYKKPKSCKNILRKSNSLLRPPKGVVSHLVRRVSTRNVWIRPQNTTYQYNAGQKMRCTLLCGVCTTFYCGHQSRSCRTSFDAYQRETSESGLKTLPTNIMQAKNRDVLSLSVFFSKNSLTEDNWSGELVSWVKFLYMMRRYGLDVSPQRAWYMQKDSQY